MGMTVKSPEQVRNLIKMMGHEWTYHRYDTLRYNCCHFCDAFCDALGVDTLPFWVSLNISGVGASLNKWVNSTFAWQPADGIPDQDTPRPDMVEFGGQFNGGDDGSGGIYSLGDDVQVLSNSTQIW